MDPLTCYPPNAYLRMWNDFHLEDVVLKGKSTLGSFEEWGMTCTSKTPLPWTNKQNRS
jgi:hypothetical protein